MFKQQLFLYVC